MTDGLARHALLADLPGLEVALAEAFADDPMITWVTGDDDRDRRATITAPGFFRPSLVAGLIRGHVYTVPSAGGDSAGGDSAGGAIWAPPDVRVFTDDEGAAFGAAMVEHVGADAMGRLASIADMVGSHHPGERSHFYLFILGAAQPGRGVGGCLLQPVLDRCDADRLPAYLESSNARNIAFYERHGFEVQWEDRPAADGPLFQGMWREPQS